MRSYRPSRVLALALVGLAAAGALVVCAGTAHAIRVEALCEVQGARGNDLRGLGLVVGLAGTGDKAGDAIQRQIRMLDRLDVEVTSESGIAPANVAVVAVTAKVPAFAKEGTRIDVHVSSVYDCKSLEGGTLLETHLMGVDGKTYALAQGPVSVGGFNAGGGGGGTSVRQNHVTAGRVPMGAFVEREIPSTITDGERITLLLKKPEFGTANAIREAIDAQFGPRSARAMGAGAVNVTIPPTETSDLVAFIAKVQELDIQTGMPPAKVVVNERTGTIVVGGDVLVKPCQVAHGDLTIMIATTPVVSQPEPFGQGRTVESEMTELDVVEQEAFLMPVEGTSASDVATALNKLKITPRDMISIFQALRTAGALEADLEIM